MQVNNLHSKEKIGSGQYKTDHIEADQQIIICIQIGPYRDIFCHKGIKMRTIPTDDPLPKHQHEKTGNKHGGEKQHPVVIDIQFTFIENQTVKKEQYRHIQNLLCTFVSEDQFYFK